MIALGYAVFFGGIGLLFILTCAAVIVYLFFLILLIPIEWHTRAVERQHIREIRRRLYPEENQ